MLVSSAWKLTYDPSGAPVVLVDYGALITEELDMALEKAVETVSLVDGAAPFLRVGKNAVTAFSVTVVSLAPATDAAARAAVLDSLLAAQTSTRKPLKIEVSGHAAAYWTFAESTVRRHQPRRLLAHPSPAVAVQWDIVATGLSKTPVT